MSGPLFYITIFVMLAVFAVLLAGLRNMMKQGDANLSNKMMQARVFLQFIAVVLIVVVVYLARQGSG
ncbi:twin transmembrane helix small protein [Roseitalea porphyridii]|uniref:Twin transmembrane helix small protein n=1 Tax=Roseitalea porphyridii TaxID=1852022 RepID=A0A4V1A4A0_9HYPH|nr:twin transmembrane helix small protein [Roseitalea porphyridii]QBK31888.1 twin transmembrane helix small protein [Roseitalea porphyridii]